MVVSGALGVGEVELATTYDGEAENRLAALGLLDEPRPHIAACLVLLWNTVFTGACAQTCQIIAFTYHRARLQVFRGHLEMLSSDLSLVH